MAVTVQIQFESVVTELYQDAFVGSSIENGTTIIPFDLRKLDFQRALGTTSTICWRQALSHVDIHALSTFHNPITYRFSVAQGSFLNDQNQRVYFTPNIKGVSTSQQMSKSIIRLACSLAVVRGVSLRQIALLFSSLFLMPVTKSSIKRWIDDIGSHLPTPEAMLQHLLALTPATECHMDGDYPQLRPLMRAHEHLGWWVRPDLRGQGKLPQSQPPPGTPARGPQASTRSVVTMSPNQ